MQLRPGERLDDLGRGGLRIIQHPGRFPFALDPVLLSHFATVRRRDRVLDLGTGSGVVPLLLAARYPEVRITGLELQSDLADMAARSIALNRLADRIHIECGDWRDSGDTYEPGLFDLVTLNPPYRERARGNVSPDPVRALARHELTGSLKDAVQAAAKATRYRGRVAVTFLAERLVELLAQMRTHGLEPKRLRMVHPRAERPANLVLVEAVRGGGTALRTEPPLIVYEQGQVFTRALQEIYSGTPCLRQGSFGQTSMPSRMR